MIRTGLLLITAVCLTANAAQVPSQPNVLFFALDDLCDWVGPNGYEQAVTPNMDRLAAEGVVFENAYTVCPVCSPARASIMTGVYPHRHGICANVFQNPGSSSFNPS